MCRRMKCGQCQMLSINGVPCHETGCPNEKKAWRGGEWVEVFECKECGSKYEDAEEAGRCCTWEAFEADPPSDEDDIFDGFPNRETYGHGLSDLY